MPLEVDTVLLWPQQYCTTGGYSRSEAATVTSGQGPQGFMSQKSQLDQGHMVTLIRTDHSDVNLMRTLDD